MPRESVQEKAFRYLREGRLTIDRADPEGVVVARCRGTEGEYALGYDLMRKQWRCTCMERKGQCSHLTALRTLFIR